MKDDDPNHKHFPPDGESRETFEGNRFEDSNLQRVHIQLMREKEEPSENFSPMPLVFVALFMALSFWAGIYLIRTSGNFDPYHYDETQEAGHGAADEGPQEVDLMQVGRAAYARNCQACHQANGNGLPGVYPPVANSNWVQDNPQRLIKVVLSGLGGPVTVNGTQYNNQMTPFGPVLSDQQVAGVLTYIRTAPDFGNESYPVSEELVTQIREEYGSRSEVWTQEELEAIHGPVTGEWQPEGGAAAPEGETESGDTAGDEEAASPEGESNNNGEAAPAEGGPATA